MPMGSSWRGPKGYDGHAGQIHSLENPLERRDDEMRRISPVVPRILVAVADVTVNGGSEEDLRTRVRSGVCQPTNKGEAWTGVAAHQEDGVDSGAARCMMAPVREGRHRGLLQLLRGTEVLLDLRVREGR
jgi:hypothetical protein